MATPTPRARNVADLKASILQPALTSTYECHFDAPTAVRNWINGRRGLDLGSGYTSTLQEKVTLACREAALPGTSLATHTIDNDRTGITERHVYRRQYDTSASFTFYVDENYDIIYFFENWIAFIVNESATGTVQNDNYSYRVNFPKEYKSEIFIRKFERDYKGRNLQYKFLNAFPISINQMPVSYDESQLMLCTVNFNFSRYLVSAE